MSDLSKMTSGGAQAPLPKDDPLVVAWESYKQSDNFANSRRWAAQAQHLDGSLWNMFATGWFAAMEHKAAPPSPGEKER